MSFETARPAAAARLTAQEAGQRLEHERNARLTQLKALDAAGSDADAHLGSVQKEAIERVLTEIEAAFGRVHAGTYGTCMACSKTIPAERLEILPYVRFCVGCQGRTS
ncbi:TraR/DksA C4-type zinc finger protein [Streptomyces sp. PU-14G]|uniref:TraR/DksA C4-type zinc finger protein n=1 Tax=Streptomyces sp. PU-14G TaxID=2800808 RepID=UPI0034DF2281